jgi:hypothetical protein
MQRQRQRAVDDEEELLRMQVLYLINIGSSPLNSSACTQTCHLSIATVSVVPAGPV